ncbi:lipase 1-like [Choristoneura fumiferana]|uniref:lipase 1-like n=1 Tax=Choristoneura fumiferana TaxID=7141 RepID=UPI003D1592EC
MKIKITFAYLVIIVNSALASSLFPTSLTTPLPEDALLNFTGLGVKYGHKVEEHSVVTEDGYILLVFRIPGKRKTPVMLMHGTGDSSDSYIIRGNRSLAISLANQDYDVWAVNGRGNRYSRRHVRLNPDKNSAFWDFSFHERGYYDLAATIDYILQITGETGVISVGHSQGTTNNFVLLSSRPEYNDKVKLCIALAPVAFLDNLVLPISLLAAFGPTIDGLLSPLQLNEIGGYRGIERSLFKFFCNQGIISYVVCVIIGIFPGQGYDAKRLEPSFLPVALGHVPAGDSKKGLLHHNQAVLSKRFAPYDYGPVKNKKLYGHTVPPEYNLSQATAKIALIVGKNDHLSRVRDVEKLKMHLPNVVKYHVMQENEWNHLDFVWGNDMPETLFPVIFPLFEKYS